MPYVTPSRSWLMLEGILVVVVRAYNVNRYQIWSETHVCRHWAAATTRVQAMGFLWSRHWCFLGAGIGVFAVAALVFLCRHWSYTLRSWRTIDELCVDCSGLDQENAF